jgi:hypothetical protein
MVALLQAPDLATDFGCELLTPALTLIQDISDEVSAGKVSRDNLANIHGTVDLTLTRELAWGRDRTRPFMLLSSPSVGVTDVRWNLGVYLMTTPVTVLGESPQSRQTTGFDLLHLLQAQVGDSYFVPGGTNVLAAIRAVFTAAGITTPVLIDSSAGSKFLGTPRVWPLTSSESPTWVQILNDLCKAITYRAVWVDQDGNFRIQPYVPPIERSTEFVLDVGGLVTGIVADDRSVVQDLWGIPNRWRFIRNDLATPPVESNGRYTRNNVSEGPSSQTSLGRVVPADVMFLDATSQGDLQSQGDKIVAAAMRVAEVITLKVSPFPAAGHYDRFAYIDAALGVPRETQCRSWTLPLDGADMDFELETL